MVSQVLYGEGMRLLTERKKWYEVETTLDGYSGWIDAKQFHSVKNDDFDKLKSEAPHLVTDIFEYVSLENGSLMLVPLGSRLNCQHLLLHTSEINPSITQDDRTHLVQAAMLFLNAPYMWGGRSFMGIDCSGFIQVVYKLIGQSIPRDACDQAQRGEAMSFIEEAKPGDLAFFDNAEGDIIHVGMLLADNHIIHAHGKVRIDRLDHTGIFNEDTQTYSHKLRVLKRILN